MHIYVYEECEEVRSPVVRGTIVVFGDEFVVALEREVEGGCGDADSSEDEDGPASRAERPGEVEVPAGPEAGVVVEKVSLGVSVVSHMNV
jgi:hypothetical protein